VTDSPSSASGRRANITGLGLIGGSLGFALRERGWYVTGDDVDPAVVARALQLGVIDTEGLDPTAAITFVATPVLAVADQVKRALAETEGLVTDVGSVKGGIAASIADARFVGGHPMAGSELEGLDGADAEMFVGAVWVLTPSPTTADETFSAVAAVAVELGAEVVALPPDRHDQVVAVISHVPHLTAATLMGLASDRAEEHAALLRLAAGGFRDMTRIASGHPAIWLDICAENRPAILSALDGLIDGLTSMRHVVDTDDRAGLHRRLTKAREARVNLPSRVNQPNELAEARIPYPGPTGRGGGDLHAGGRARGQHRQLRSGAQRRGQQGGRRRPRRRDQRRAVPRRSDRSRVPACRAAPRVMDLG